MLTTLLAWGVRYAVPLLAGMGLGLIFFGGLWWTVRRVPTARQPALLTLASFFGRTAVAVGGFYWIMDGELVRLAVAMGGFLLSRSLLVWRWRPPRQTGPFVGPSSRPDDAQANRVTPGGVTYDLEGTRNGN